MMPEREGQLDFESLLPFPAELDGCTQLEDADMVTCYRVLLSLHQLMSNALALPIPGPNRLICGIMRADLDRALLAVRTIQRNECRGRTGRSGHTKRSSARIKPPAIPSPRAGAPRAGERCSRSRPAPRTAAQSDRGPYRCAEHRGRCPSGSRRRASPSRICR